MAQPNQMMIIQNTPQNQHMLVNVAGSTGFNMGQAQNNMAQMGNMVQIQPQSHAVIHQVSLVLHRF